jgi:hypothetical protein
MTIDSGIVFGIISVVTSLLIAAFTYGSLTRKVDNMCEKHSEYKAEHTEKHDREDEINREKFKELYESRNDTAIVVERLTVLIEQVFKELGQLNAKVDKLLSRDKQE